MNSTTLECHSCSHKFNLSNMKIKKVGTSHFQFDNESFYLLNHEHESNKRNVYDQDCTFLIMCVSCRENGNMEQVIDDTYPNGEDIPYIQTQQFKTNAQIIVYVGNLVTNAMKNSNQALIDLQKRLSDKIDAAKQRRNRSISRERQKNLNKQILLNQVMNMKDSLLNPTNLKSSKNSQNKLLVKSILNQKQQSELSQFYQRLQNIQNMFDEFGSELASIQSLKAKISTEIKSVTRTIIQDYLKYNLNNLKRINDELQEKKKKVKLLYYQNQENSGSEAIQPKLMQSLKIKRGEMKKKMNLISFLRKKLEQERELSLLI